MDHKSPCACECSLLVTFVCQRPSHPFLLSSERKSYSCRLLVSLRLTDQTMHQITQQTTPQSESVGYAVCAAV